VNVFVVKKEFEQTYIEQLSDKLCNSPPRLIQNASDKRAINVRQCSHSSAVIDAGIC